MLKLFIVMLSLGVSIAEVKLGYSTFSNSNVYISDYTTKISALDERFKYYLNQTKVKSFDKDISSISMGVDTISVSGLEYFLFAKDDGISRVGSGIAYTIPDTNYKASVAIVQDSSNGTICSIRFKASGVHSIIGYSITSFILGYTYTLDYKLTISTFYSIKLSIAGLYEDTRLNTTTVALEL